MTSERVGGEPQRESKEIIAEAFRELERDSEHDFNYWLLHKHLKEATDAGDRDQVDDLFVKINASIEERNSRKEDRGGPLALMDFARFAETVSNTEGVLKKDFLGHEFVDVHGMVGAMSDEEKKAHPHILVDVMQHTMQGHQDRYGGQVGQWNYHTFGENSWTDGPVAKALEEGKTKEEIVAELIEKSKQPHAMEIDEEKAGLTVDFVSGKAADDLIEENREFIPDEVLENLLRYDSRFGHDIGKEDREARKEAART